MCILESIEWTFDVMPAGVRCQQCTYCTEYQQNKRGGGTIAEWKYFPSIRSHFIHNQTLYGNRFPCVQHGINEPHGCLPFSVLFSHPINNQHKKENKCTRHSFHFIVASSGIKPGQAQIVANNLNYTWVRQAKMYSFDYLANRLTTITLCNRLRTALNNLHWPIIMIDQHCS